MSIYDFSVLDQEGKEAPLRAYEGKVLLIVNTATGCRFTPQYKELQDLWLRFKDRDFAILDFPCDQFLRQAKGSDEEIHSFCLLHFGIGFPQFHKIEVNGKNASPLFAYLKNEKKGTLGKRIPWNFTKFLVDKEGNVIARYAPSVVPSAIAKDIEALL